MSNLNYSNAAVESEMRVPPSILEEVAKDPSYIREYARKSLMIQVAALTEKLQEPDVSNSVRMSAIDLLGKIGDVYVKQNQVQATGDGAPKFSVVINLAGDNKPAPLPHVEVVEQLADASAPVLE